MEDISDNNKWINVQEPIREIITSIAKAVRTQSTGIRDLDRKLGYCITKDNVEKLVYDHFSKCYNKEVTHT